MKSQGAKVNTIYPEEDLNVWSKFNGKWSQNGEDISLKNHKMSTLWLSYKKSQSSTWHHKRMLMQEFQAITLNSMIFLSEPKL